MKLLQWHWNNLIMESQAIRLLIIITIVFTVYIWRSLKNKDSKAEELFGFDLRSLALFRIVVAFVILADLLNRFPDLNIFYNDTGLMPRSLAVNYIHIWSYSIHFISGRVEIQAILFLLAAIFAFLLLIGYRTKLMTFLSWFFLISLEHRDALALDGGDFELRLLLFWGMLLPLGACFSIDSLMNKSKEELPKRFFSMGSAAYCLQFAFIYWFSIILKLRNETWRDGTAVYYAITNVSLETYFSKLVFELPMDVLHFMTNSVIAFESLGPLLFFIPVFNGPIRTISVIGYVFMHICFGICIDLEIFHLVSSAAALHFLPSWFWEKIDLLLSNFFSNFLIKDKRVSTINLKSSLLSNVLATYFLFSVLAINLWSVDPKKYDFPRPFMYLISFLSIDQMWGMYTAPGGWSSGWPVSVGKLKDGSEIDIFRNGQSVKWDKPEIGSEMYKNRNWRRYILSVIADPTYQPNLPYYAGNLCREWNNTHKGDKELQEFDIYFMKWDPKPNHKFVRPEKSFVWKQYCFYSQRSVDEILNEVVKKSEGNAITAVIDLYSNASLFIYQQKYSEAEILYKKALELLGVEYGANDVRLTQILTAIEAIQRLQGRNEEANNTNTRIKNLVDESKSQEKTN